MGWISQNVFYQLSVNLYLHLTSWFCVAPLNCKTVFPLAFTPVFLPFIKFLSVLIFSELSDQVVS